MLRVHLYAMLFLFNASESGAAAEHVVYLDQGWSDDEREQFYYTTQGSQLIPYDWFLALERAGSQERFAADVNMERLGFIPEGSSSRNPDGLPIGFVKDDNPATVQDPSIKRSFLGSEFNNRNSVTLTNAWLGLTCAACHTSQIEYDGHEIRIDGGPATADVQTFLADLSKALKATIDDAATLERFARTILSDNYNEDERDDLRDRMNAYWPALERLVRRGTGKHPYGFGRLDAFGAILNEVCDTSLDNSANYFPSDAPASFPFLWGTPQLDWVQWNGTADNPLGRNVGEVIGVFGQINLRPDPPEAQFSSTAHLENLFRLEEQIWKLQSPKWPEQVFGKIDAVLAKQGQQLYEQNCMTCHAVREPASGEFPMTRPNKFGKQFVKTRMIPLDEIGTDPALAMNFATRKADPGFLMPSGSAPVPRPVLLSIAVEGAIKRKIAQHMPPLDQETILRINGFRDPAAEPPNPMAYKARPLDGIWATGPYLHNGSVPNLCELLLPARKRSKSFHVGNRQFDASHVGYSVTNAPGTFEFKIADGDGPISGNSNAGHEGHGPGHKLGYTETYENGAWREFTDGERTALVEYLKTLGGTDAGGAEPATTKIEDIPAREADQIQHIVALTIKQLQNRYPGGRQVLRGVHAKDHGCVKAEFTVAAELPASHRVGIFSEPGRRYDAWVRFSNAATLVLPDDPIDEDSGKPVPGSRGMAIKVLGVTGEPLVQPFGALTQDFLMVNHPVFAFANVEDYEVLSEVLADPANLERPNKFFRIQKEKGGSAAARAGASFQIISRIRAPNVAGGAYQPQPATPVDCRYFSGAPFLFGEGAVMKFSAVPMDAPAEPAPNTADPNYLRNGLIGRLREHKDARPVVFQFQVQRREISSLDVANDIENACTEWPESTYPFVTVATLTIPPQDFDSPERRALCEALFFTPWHGVNEFRPLGGINRMRQAVYEASSNLRHQPKEPSGR